MDRENKTALIINTEVPLTHHLPKIEAEKSMKYEKSLTTNLYLPWPSQQKQ
jgi:hypothetical protein